MSQSPPNFSTTNPHNHPNSNQNSFHFAGISTTIPIFSSFQTPSTKNSHHQIIHQVSPRKFTSKMFHPSFKIHPIIFIPNSQFQLKIHSNFNEFSKHLSTPKHFTKKHFQIAKFIVSSIFHFIIQNSNPQPIFPIQCYTITHFSVLKIPHFTNFSIIFNFHFSFFSFSTTRRFTHFNPSNDHFSNFHSQIPPEFSQDFTKSKKSSHFSQSQPPPPKFCQKIPEFQKKSGIHQIKPIPSFPSNSQNSTTKKQFPLHQSEFFKTNFNSTISKNTFSHFSHAMPTNNPI